MVPQEGQNPYSACREQYQLQSVKIHHQCSVGPRVVKKCVVTHWPTELNASGARIRGSEGGCGDNDELDELDDPRDEVLIGDSTSRALKFVLFLVLPSPGACADLLTSLSDEGYNVPASVIETLREEEAEIGSGREVAL